MTMTTAIMMMVMMMAMKLTGGHLTEPLDEYEHLQPNARRLHRTKISRFCAFFRTPSFLLFLRLFQNFSLSGSCPNCLLQDQLIQTGRSILFSQPSFATGQLSLDRVKVQVLIKSEFNFQQFLQCALSRSLRSLFSNLFDYEHVLLRSVSLSVNLSEKIVHYKTKHCSSRKGLEMIVKQYFQGRNRRKVVSCPPLINLDVWQHLSKRRSSNRLSYSSNICRK